MHKNSRFIFIIIIINISLIQLEPNNSNIISLRFKTYYPCSNNSIYNIPSFTTDDYFEKIHLSKIYLEVGTGDESNFESQTNQTLNIIVDLKEIIFLTTNVYFEKYIVENNNLLCHYNTSKSSTFYEIPKYIKLDGINFLTSYAKENFKIYTDISLSKYKIERLNFVNTIDHNISNICGNIGLGFTHPESISYNFIGQLHKNFDLTDYSFIFNYTNINEGIFILGNMPHVYLPEKYNIENLVSIYSLNNKEPLINIYEMIMEREKYKIDFKDEQIKIKINPDIDGFEFPNKYFTDIEEIAFTNYYSKNICHKEVYRRIYSVVYCEGGEGKFTEKDIISFPNITYYFDKTINFSVQFTGKDLFYIKDNKYFFKIIENTLGEYMIIGRILLKKYLTIFNQDKKQIYFYNNINIDDKNKENKEKETNYENNSSSSFTIIIIVCIICAVIFFPLGIYFGHKLFSKRNKKAYELNDGYDYSPAQDGKEQLAINNY